MPRRAASICSNKKENHTFTSHRLPPSLPPSSIQCLPTYLLPNWKLSLLLGAADVLVLNSPLLGNEKLAPMLLLPLRPVAVLVVVVVVVAVLPLAGGGEGNAAGKESGVVPLPLVVVVLLARGKRLTVGRGGLGWEAGARGGKRLLLGVLEEAVLTLVVLLVVLVLGVGLVMLGGLEIELLGVGAGRAAALVRVEDGVEAASGWGGGGVKCGGWVGI